MKFTRELPARLVVRRVTATEIVVNDETHEESVALTPDAMIGAWPATSIADLTREHFDDVLASRPEIVLLGTGVSNVFPPRELMFAFARMRIGFEVMDTAAAARTFNVLANEGRKVAAVLTL